MGELRQKAAGVKTNFQGITPKAKADTRSEVFGAAGDIFKAGAGAVATIGQNNANEDAEDFAFEFSGAGKSEKQVQQNVDLFDDGVEQGIAGIESATGEFATDRDLKVINDEVMNRVNLTQRGLQSAIDNGSITFEEAQARARIVVQRETNSLRGNLFKGDVQAALAKFTGAGAGSPAFAFTKSSRDLAADQIKEDEAKMIAAKETAINGMMNIDSSLTRDVAEDMYVSRQRTAEAARIQVLADTQRTRNSPDIRKGSQLVISTKMQDFSSELAPYISGEILMDVGTANAAMAKVDLVIGAERQRLTGTKILVDDLDKWEAQMKSYRADHKALVDLVQAGTITDAQIKIRDNLANLKIGELFPEVVAATALNEAVGTSFATMNTSQQSQLLKLRGVDAKDWDEMKRVVRAASKVYAPREGQKPPTDEEKKMAEDYLSVQPPEIQAAILAEAAEKEKASGNVKGKGVKDEHYNRYQNTSPESLHTNRSGIDKYVGAGNKEAAELLIQQFNGGVRNFDNYRKFNPEAQGEITIKPGADVNNVFPEIDGKISISKASITFPKDMPSEYKDMIKRSYLSLLNSRMLWQDDFDSAEDALEAMYNQGFMFSATEFTGRMKKGAVSTDSGGNKRSAAGTLDSRTEAGLDRPGGGEPDAEQIEFENAQAAIKQRRETNAFQFQTEQQEFETAEFARQQIKSAIERQRIGDGSTKLSNAVARGIGKDPGADADARPAVIEERRKQEIERMKGEVLGEATTPEEKALSAKFDELVQQANEIRNKPGRVLREPASLDPESVNKLNTPSKIAVSAAPPAQQDAFNAEERPALQTAKEKTATVVDRVKSDENSIKKGFFKDKNGVEKVKAYILDVKGKGFEVDIGFGQKIKAGIKTKAEAEKIRDNVPEQTMEQANAFIEKEVGKALKEVDSKIDKDKLTPLQRETFAELLYQGGRDATGKTGLDVTTWKKTYPLLLDAIEFNEPADWLEVQRNMLDSKWATSQTPERALRKVHQVFPDTPIDALERIQKRMKKNRGVK